MQSGNANTEPGDRAGQPTQYPSQEALSAELDQGEVKLRQAAKKKLNGEYYPASTIFRAGLRWDICHTGNLDLLERLTELIKYRNQLVMGTIPPSLLPAPQTPCLEPKLSRIQQGRLEFHKRFKALESEIEGMRRESSAEADATDRTALGRSFGEQEPIVSGGAKDDHGF